MKRATKFLAFLLLAAGLTAASTADAATNTAQFIRKATIGNGFEIMSSRIALDRSDNDEVRDFARRMIETHDQADDQLRDAVRHSGYRMKSMPNDLDKKHRAMIRQLEGTPPGETFDRLYIRMQTQAHNEALALYQNYARSGSNPALRDYARDLLPELHDHRDNVREVRFYR